MRRLGPESLGQAGLALATVSIVGLVSQLGLDVIIPKRVSEAKTVAEKLMIAGALYSLRITFLVLFSPLFIFGIAWQWKTVVDTEGGLRLVLIWAAAFYYIIGVACNPQAWLQGIDGVKQLGNRQLLSSLCTTVLFLACFYWMPQTEVFVFIQALGLLLVAWLVFRENDVLPHITLKLSDFYVLARHVRQSWSVIANSLVAYCFGGLEGLILAGAADHHQIGLFGAATMLSNGVNAFLSLIPLALYPRMLEWVKRSESLAMRRVTGIGVAALLGAVGIYVVAGIVCNLVVPMLLGAEFKASGDLLTALIVQYVAYIACYAITTLLVVLGRQNSALAVAVSGAVIAVPLYYFAARSFGAYGVAHAKLAIYLWMVIFGIILLRRASEKNAI